MNDIDYSPQQATNVCLGVANIKRVLETFGLPITSFQDLYKMIKIPQKEKQFVIFYSFKRLNVNFSMSEILNTYIYVSIIYKTCAKLLHVKKIF